MSRRWWRLGVVLVVLAVVAAACSSDDDDDDTAATGGDGGGGGASLLAEVRQRGELICGVNRTLPGFGVVDESGEHVGFDIDYCKAVAAAIFGSSDGNVRYVDLTAEQRFTALQSGEIDILIRNTTWTATRDGNESLRFGPTTFYDGQGFMAPAASGLASATDLEGARICVQSGTTTELNLTSYLGSIGVDFEPVVFEDNTELVPAYQAGQCEAVTSDRSQLTALKFQIEGEGGADQLILPETISKEPLGPAVLDGEEELAEVMDWTVFATFQAEEFGITQANVGSFSSDDPNVVRFLGQEANFDPGLGLDADFAVNVISEVGNYEEIYERHLVPIGLDERGVNSLWTDGGLLYAPPYR